MFLKTVANPYTGGKPTRSVMYRPNETQTFAIDAEQLYRNPKLLNAFGRWRSLAIRALDVVAYSLILVGIAGAIYVAWWFFLPCFVANAAMLMANRKAAGEMAKSAAHESNENFFYLHDQRALWLVPEPFLEEAA
ncbi:MAG: hypothetical protein AAGK23_11040 [Pseudomonadota bacterium]